MDDIKKEPAVALETKTEAKKTDKKKAKVIEVVLKNSKGEEVAIADYFFKGVVPPGFINTCGKPVDREDLNEAFNKIFKPDYGMLFYKAIDKEVYLVIPPIKYATTIGEEQNSINGDFQKHAISFLNEGSVNIDTLKLKLKRILPFCKFSDN